MEQITPGNINKNNPFIPSPMGQSKKPFNTKLVLILAGAAVLVGAGVFGVMYPGGEETLLDKYGLPPSASTQTPNRSASPAGDTFSFVGEAEKPDYFDDNVRVTEQIEYKIEAIDENGKVVKSYGPVSVKIPQATTVFNSTKDVWAWGSDTYIDLKWNPYNFKRFKIYRSVQNIDETANWQTYRNEEYGFEMKYPKEASVVLPSKGGGIVYVGTINSGHNYGITFDSLGLANNKSAENWYSQYYQNKRQEATKLNAPFFLSATGQNIQLNNYVAYKTIDFGVDRGIINFYIVYNGSMYKLTYEDEEANDPKWNEHEKIINQILSTFKFTESAAATGDSVKIFLIAPDDNGIIGKKVGCGDSVVSVGRSIEPTSGPLKAALNELFSLKEKDYGQSGLYNALYQSKISVDSVNIVNGKAEVRLSGSIISGGACDSPRIQAQIEETIKQFPSVQSFSIFLNGSEENYKKLFSGR